MDWLTLTAKAMHKGGDRDKCGSYRPVSLTSIVLKTLEGAVCDRMVTHLEAKKQMVVGHLGFDKDVHIGST